MGDQQSIFISIGPRYRHYYLWFFGFVAKLPFEREIDAAEMDSVQIPETLSPR